MKRIIKQTLVRILGYQVLRLRKRNYILVVGVVGSIGKTSTKSAIANVLSAKYRVRYQAGNYNDILSVPLVFFGQVMPPLYNPFAWLRILIRTQKISGKHFDPEVVVVELGTDGPGQIDAFRKYLKLDVAVVTAITPEHMEQFGRIDNVAKEELAVQNYADSIIVNKDLCDNATLAYLHNEYIAYGTSQDADRRIVGLTRAGWSVITGTHEKIRITKQTISDVEAYSVTAAVLVGKVLEMTDEQIEKGISKVRTMPGRLNILSGIHESLIIDDTYNSSPDAAISALKALYAYPATKRIALLGSMNEMGDESPLYHQQVGEFCDPARLDLVITLGTDANEYLARAAEDSKCRVVRTRTPYEAGKLLKQELKKGTVLLAKGSQNGVFAEEALKPLLADKNDRQQLVRQSSSWLSKKKKAFS